VSSVRQAKPDFSNELKGVSHEIGIHHVGNPAVKGVIPKPKPGKSNL